MENIQKKTIIFDLGGVVFTDGTKNAIQKIAKNYEIPEEKVKDILQWPIGTQYRIGEITVEEFRDKAKEYRDKPEINAKTLTNIWLEGYTPITSTIEIIKKLQKEWYELLFLSDNVKERVDYLEEKYHFQEMFKDGVYSHLMWTRKPDLKMYTEALNKASNIAENCIYIDDKENLLLPAKELWMQTIHFKLAEQKENTAKQLTETLLAQELKKYWVEI